MGSNYRPNRLRLVVLNNGAARVPKRRKHSERARGDNADIRDVLAYHIQHEGYETVTAVNGDDAISQLHAGLRPCLIVLDLAMPVKDGFAFRRKQRADPELGAIPVVIYSQQYEARTHAVALDAIPTGTCEGIADLDSLSRIIRVNCLKTTT